MGRGLEALTLKVGIVAWTIICGIRLVVKILTNRRLKPIHEYTSIVEYQLWNISDLFMVRTTWSRQNVYQCTTNMVIVFMKNEDMW